MGASLECQWGQKRVTERIDAAYSCVDSQQTDRRYVSETCRCMRTLIVTCGVVDLGSFVDEGLPGFWEDYVKNNDVPTATRKNGLTAWLWVCMLPQ
jgi:hypothetical protein